MARFIARLSRPALPACIAIVGAVAVSGCTGPTYGTDKTAGEQLVDDLGSALSLRSNNTTKINYQPRPDLVTPPDGTVLPPPQQNVTEQPGAWPETPEERRARILAEIEDGNRVANFAGTPDAERAVGASTGPARSGPPGAQRVFLTDPPTEYRQPAASADYGDLGQTEAQKERALKRAQGKKSGLSRLIPWL